MNDWSEFFWGGEMKIYKKNQSHMFPKQLFILVMQIWWPAPTLDHKKSNLTLNTDEQQPSQSDIFTDHYYHV